MEITNSKSRFPSVKGNKVVRLRGVFDPKKQILNNKKGLIIIWGYIRLYSDQVWNFNFGLHVQICLYIFDHCISFVFFQ